MKTRVRINVVRFDGHRRYTRLTRSQLMVLPFDTVKSLLGRGALRTLRNGDDGITAATAAVGQLRRL